jgi:hypothetical protein
MFSEMASHGVRYAMFNSGVSARGSPANLSELVLGGLDREDAVKAGVTGFEDLAHATSSDRLDYLVGSEAAAGRGLHRQRRTSIST